MAGKNIHLKIKGIDGESSDDKHKGEIDVEKWSWGTFNSGSMHRGGGGGVGKAEVHDLHVVMETSKASPKLMLACATGEHITEATLTLTKSGKTPQDFLIFKMTDLMISSYQAGSDDKSPKPVESITINFAKVEYQYKPQADDGTVGKPEIVTYNVRADKA